MRRLITILTIIISAMFILSCSVTRHIPDNSYLLQKVNIETDKSTERKYRITSDDAYKYVSQKPNKRFLGLNFYVAAYNAANPDKDNWWNDLKRKIGQEPVLYDHNKTEQSVGKLKIYLDKSGYFASEVKYSVDTTKRRKRAIVTYSLKQNQPYFVGSVKYQFRDRFLEQILAPDTVNNMIRTGDIFNISTLEAERERIAAQLNRQGYYDFTINNIEFLADTLQVQNVVNLTMIVKKKIEYNRRGEVTFEDSPIYRLRSIKIIPNYNALEDKKDANYMQSFDSVNYRGLTVLYKGKKPYIRPEVLRTAVSMYPGSIYDVEQKAKTNNRLLQMGFNSAQIQFNRLPDSLFSTQAYITYVGQPDSTDTPIIHNKERYLDCKILCTPSLRQSIKAELEGSTTSSFYGLKASLGYQNRNIFRGAELFDLTGTVGYEYMKAPDAMRRSAIEFGLSAGLTFPRFLIFHTSSRGHLNSPKTRFEMSFNHQNRPYYRRDLSSIVWSYSWQNWQHSSFVVRPISINWVNVGYINENYFNSLQNEYLKRSYESQLIVGLSGTYSYDNSRLQTTKNQTTIRVNAELAGNTVDGLMHLFSKPVENQNYYNFLGIRYSQYFRADINAAHRISIGEKCAVAGRIYAGFGIAYGNSDAIPFDRMFYAGGSNSMRGWAPRTLGPGSSPLPENVVYPTQLGDMKLEANLEFRFPIWGMFHGATFLDVGNIWYMGRNGVEYPESSVFHIKDFYKQLGFNTGIGVRLDIKFAILRLDWGIQLHNPNKVASERWIHNFKWKNTSINFGVGYPF